MFSRKEREFLQLLGGTRDGEGSEEIRRQFPNAVYRRRLLWGIRKKASQAAGDLELYAKAAKNEQRVVQPLGNRAVPTVPVYSEPFARLVFKLTGVTDRGARAAVREPSRRRGG